MTTLSCVLQKTSPVRTWLQGLDYWRGNGCGVVEDRAALVALYNATDGDNWSTSTHWLSDRPMWEWHGVGTDEEGRVSGLWLGKNNLSGEIPSDLGNLNPACRPLNLRQ